MSAERTIQRSWLTVPVFEAFSNALRKQQLIAADLTPGVKIVDSEVAELVRKQEADWSYLKPGS
jgi:intracellular sulfur oxidation DsrE/DsrF family protein